LLVAYFNKEVKPFAAADALDIIAIVKNN